jgi:hypothetical protein
MPVSYAIDAELRCVHTRCAGAVSPEDIAAHLDVLQKDPAAPRPLNVLLDLTELTSLPQAGQILVVAAEVRRAETNILWGVCAIVAPRDEAFGAARMFERLTARSFERTRSFRDVASARAWLASVR